MAMKREPVEIVCLYPGTKLGERRMFRGIGREFFELLQGLASRMDLDTEWSRDWHRRISKIVGSG